MVGHDKSVGVFASTQGEVVRIAMNETTKARIQHASRATVTHLILIDIELVRVFVSRVIC